MESISRRAFLRGAAATGAASGAAALLGSRAWAAPALWKQPGSTDASVADQLHIAYGADPSSQMTVSWHTATSVSTACRPSATTPGPAGWSPTPATSTRCWPTAPPP